MNVTSIFKTFFVDNPAFWIKDVASIFTDVCFNVLLVVSMKSVSKAASYCDKSGLPIKYDWYCLSNQSAAVAAAVSNAFFLALAVVVKIVGIEYLLLQLELW